MKIKEILNEGKSVADLNLNYEGGDLKLSSKGLTSLYGCPEKIDGFFTCANNKLVTLEGGPKFINGGYYCGKNNLISLKGVAKYVEYFSCEECNLTSLDFLPEQIKFGLNCNMNKITSFKNINDQIKEFEGSIFCQKNPIKEGLLHILLIKNVYQIYSPFKQIDKIINTYLSTNKSGSMRAVIEVQKLIIEAKLKGIPKSLYME